MGKTSSQPLPAGSCQECGHTWAPASVKDFCPGCGGKNVTISIPKKARDNKRKF